MRILQVLHDFLPRSLGGVEVYTDRLAQRLAAEHAVGILYRGDDLRGSQERVERGRRGEAATYAIALGGGSPRFEQGYRDARVDRLCAEVLDAFRPDLVHVQHLARLSLGLVDELEHRGIPRVMTLHDHWLACAHGGQRFHPELGRCDELDAARCAACTAYAVGPSLWARHLGRALPAGAATRARASRRLARAVRAAASAWPGRPGRRIEARWTALRRAAGRFDRLLSPSRFLARECLRYGIPAARIAYCPLGLPVEAFRRREDLPDRARRFAFVGSLVPHKGVHVLLEAFASLPAEAELDVYGSPESDPGYASRLEPRHPGIRLRGAVAPERVPDVLRQADCLVVPSLWHENAPLVVQEAFLAGVPVVASRIAGLAELLAAGGGACFETGDIAALGALLGRLYREPGLARRLAATAPPVKPMKEHAAELTSLYQSLLPEVGRRDDRA